MLRHPRVTPVQEPVSVEYNADGYCRALAEVDAIAMTAASHPRQP
jgi:hypothetical protein